MIDRFITIKTKTDIKDMRLYNTWVFSKQAVTLLRGKKNFASTSSPAVVARQTLRRLHRKYSNLASGEVVVAFYLHPKDRKIKLMVYLFNTKKNEKNTTINNAGVIVGPTAGTAVNFQLQRHLSVHLFPYEFGNWLKAWPKDNFVLPAKKHLVSLGFPILDDALGHELKSYRVTRLYPGHINLIALKEFPKKPLERARWNHELDVARYATSHDCTSTLPLLGSFEKSQKLGLAWSLENLELGPLLKTQDLPEIILLPLIRDLVIKVMLMHQCGIVHGSLTPSSIFITTGYDTEFHRIKVNIKIVNLGTAWIKGTAWPGQKIRWMPEQTAFTAPELLYDRDDMSYEDFHPTWENMRKADIFAVGFIIVKYIASKSFWDRNEGGDFGEMQKEIYWEFFRKAVDDVWLKTLRDKASGISLETMLDPDPDQRNWRLP
jgi:hypothetical protein